MSVNHQEIRRYLNVIKRAVGCVETLLDADDGGLMEQLAAEVVPRAPEAPLAEAARPRQAPPVRQEAAEVPTPPAEADPAEFVTPEQAAARQKHVADLLAIDCWPEAVPPFLAKREPSTEDQINRAKAVLDMMLYGDLQGTHFLDFGCGDGWIAHQALARGVIKSVGYDIAESPVWKSLPGVAFTTALPKSELFDIIMLYDVLDHCADPVEVMAQVKSLLRKDGCVYVRCHPWTSKHATHLFKQGVNKAYLHLFLKWHELAELVGTPLFTREERRPLEAYHWWFNQFEVRKEKEVREPVSEFFHVPAFKELLAGEQGLTDVDAFLKLMEVQFVDFLLGRP